VIRACVTVAECLAAYTNGYRADPSGNGDYANQSGYYRRSMKALAAAAAPVITEQGIDAKARIVSVVLDDSTGSGYELNEESFAFIRSFGADVKAHFERLENLRSIEAQAAFERQPGFTPIPRGPAAPEARP
jgi:hypothetical protein